MSVRAVAKKELLQISRDPRTLTILLVVPPVLLLLFGYVLSFDVKHISLVLVDQDRSPHSRELARALTANEYFDLKATTDDAAQAQRMLDRWEATLALVIPPGFAREIRENGRPTVLALVDGSNANSAQTAVAYVEAFARTYAAGLARSAGLQLAAPVQVRQTVLYNPELRSERFLLPGLIALILMIACTLATSLSIVRERETGTMEQMLVSPLTPPQVVIGKSIPYAFISAIATTLVLLTAVGWFGMEIRGSLWWLALVTAVFIFAAQGFGLLISAATDSQQIAFMISVLATLLPTFLLSGFAFPIRSMPLVVQAITVVVPGRYFLQILRGIILRGTGPEMWWRELAALCGFGVVVTAVAFARLRKVRL